MLNRQAIVDTIVRGCAEGYFVARLMRPDKSVQTWWRQAPPADVLDDPQLELVLPDKAEITSVSSSLLRPGGIDDLWKTPQITVGETRAFFDGTHAMTVARSGYDEPMPVPRVPAPVVDAAVQAAVKEGAVWFTSGPASLLGEDVPAGLMSADALLGVVVRVTRSRLPWRCPRRLEKRSRGSPCVKRSTRRFARVCSIVRLVALIGRATTRARPACRSRCHKQAPYLHPRHLQATHAQAQKSHSSQISYRISSTSCRTSSRPLLVWR